MNILPPKEKYVKMALELGALHAMIIKPQDVVLDPRCYLKCMYGCDEWGKKWTCPSAPGAIDIWEFEKILQRYKNILLIHVPDKYSNQSISFAIEQQAFVDGYYFAFSISDCSLCKDSCAYPKPCSNPNKARPSMQSLGIDVFATVQSKSLPLSTLKNEEENQNWYSLVLIE